MQELLDVTVLEDAHLLVVGSEPERVVDVVDGDADALADEDGLAALTRPAGSPLYAVAFLGADAGCDRQVERPSARPPPEIAEQAEESGLGDLGTPDARGLFVVPDGDDVRTRWRCCGSGPTTRPRTTRRPARPGWRTASTR